MQPEEVMQMREETQQEQEDLAFSKYEPQDNNFLSLVHVLGQ